MFYIFLEKSFWGNGNITSTSGITRRKSSEKIKFSLLNITPRNFPFWNSSLRNDKYKLKWKAILSDSFHSINGEKTNNSVFLNMKNNT